MQKTVKMSVRTQRLEHKPAVTNAPRKHSNDNSTLYNMERVWINNRNFSSTQMCGEKGCGSILFSQLCQSAFCFDNILACILIEINGKMWRKSLCGFKPTCRRLLALSCLQRDIQAQRYIQHIV